MTKCLGLIRPWYFEHVPSNLLGRLIHGSFAWDGIVRTHLNDVNVWIFWTHCANVRFSYCITLKALKTSSMETINSSLDGNIATKPHQLLFQRSG